MMKVYSTNCPKCRILVKKLSDSNLEYEVIENPDEIYLASEKYNIKEAPFAVIDDKVYNYVEALRMALDNPR